MTGLLFALLLASPNCDQCSDLPKLEEELRQQEFLMKKFLEYTRESDYQLRADGVDDMKAKVVAAFNKEFNPGGSGSGGSEALPELGTDLNKKTCPLVRYTAKDKTAPFDEAAYRKTRCKPIADFAIAHEKQHQKNCLAKWKAGTQGDYDKFEFFAMDDARAYYAGIQVLRAHIQKLALDCGWEGSDDPDARKVKGPKDSPEPWVTPDAKRVAELKDRTRKTAGALGKGRKK